MRLNEVTGGAIVIDGRGKSDNEVRKIANRHFWGSDHGMVRDEGRHGSGTMLGGNMIKYYNVASVMDRIIVASVKKMTPDETRVLAREFLSQG